MTRARSAARGLVALVAILLLGACPSSSNDDAGASDAGLGEFEGLPFGYSNCAGAVCQPGTHCTDGACTVGCRLERHCGDRETCGAATGDLGVCRSFTTPICGSGFCDLGEWAETCPADCPPGYCDVEEKGFVTCGESICVPGTYCASPHESRCEPGCASNTNCACDALCDGLRTTRVGTCTPLSELSVCGDGVCDDDESDFSCPADCQDWQADCLQGCEYYALNGCFDTDPEAQSACIDGCYTASDDVRADFVACTAQGGATLCSDVCLAILDGV